MLNSSNAGFFADKIPLELESVFLLLRRQAAEVIGTPLYLKLSESAEGVL